MSGNRSLVSVLMPCFNAERYVAAAVESVLGQTWQELEVVVVNDGSTDRSGVVLEQISDPRLRVIQRRCGSASAARNAAFAECRGTHVKFFDADDILEPTTIERQMARLENSRSNIATCEWGRFYHDDVSTFRQNPESVWRDMEAMDWLLESWADAQPMMQPGIFLIPRELLSRTGLWNETLSVTDDLEFFTRVLCHVDEALFTPTACLYYRSGLEASLSGRKTRVAFESALEAVMLATSHVLARRADDRSRRACAGMLKHFIYATYPDHPDLRERAESRLSELGGSDLAPIGSPRFNRLRGLVGWKIARRIEARYRSITSGRRR